MKLSFFPFLDGGVPRSTSYGVYISLMFLALHPMEFLHFSDVPCSKSYGVYISLMFLALHHIEFIFLNSSD